MEIIIPIAVVVVIVIFFIYASKGGAKLLAEREARMAKAEKGKAVVIGSHTASIRGTGNGGHYQGYGFTLEVSNAYKEPYRAY